MVQSQSAKTGEDEPARAEVRSERPGADILKLILSGRLVSSTVGLLWTAGDRLLEGGTYSHLVVDASEVEYCDGAGIAFLVDLARKARVREKEAEIIGLRGEFQGLLAQFDPARFTLPEAVGAEPLHVVEQVGQHGVALNRALKEMISFTGEVSLAFLWAVGHPRSVRWKDVFLYMEKIGVDAVPIVGLVSFLVGLILAFQATIPMRMFGAEVFVGLLVAVAVVRELGPLMTAIVLAGRTGSALAAELGTMKINEELDALNTMGLDPVRFLVVTRVMATVIVMPFLTMFANVLGVIGGAVVFRSLGFSLVTYWDQVQSVVSLTALFGGLAKVVVFAVLVAAIGCLRGLQTGTGASAVGDSTTRAVVSGIVLIVAADGLFGVLYYVLGI